VSAFVEGGVADPAQPFQVAAHRAEIGPGDVVRRPVEVLHARGEEARQNGIDLALAADESCKAWLLSRVLLVGMAPSLWRRTSEPSG
jgi:hypothetical protein